MQFRRFVSASALALLSATAFGQTAHAQSAAATSTKPEKEGSFYLQCDGRPNNVTAGESAARFLGAVTLLGLFAPRAEVADPKLRKFGTEGVAACTKLLEGAQQEGNAQRRILLTLGRAVHRLEAKDYDGAIADAARARTEAETAGYLADPYYMQSQGRSFDLITAAALYREGKPVEARDAALRVVKDMPLLVLPALLVPDYLLADPTPSETEAGVRAALLRAGFKAPPYADRLEEWGKFAEAATIREALVDFVRYTQPEGRSTALIAQSAITLALAGNIEASDARIADARANAEQRRTAGRPDGDASEVVELFDLHGIIRMAQKGDMAGARRLFAARSQWVSASFGSVVEINRRLRVGASPDELIGGLATDPAGLWKTRLDTERARVLAQDSDNRTLFRLIDTPTPATTFRQLSKQVWRTDKSRIVLTIKDQAKKGKLEHMFLTMPLPEAALPAYTLHAALLAKSRGHQGFVLRPIVTESFIGMAFMTGNKGEPGFAEPLFLDADQSIKALSPLIPSPETIEAEKRVKH
jgi:hypothetical protein